MLHKISLLLGRPNSLKGATSILAATLFLSNVLGLLRNVILAINFKPEDLDIYYAGFQLPNLIFNLLVFGAISTAFIPVFSELIIKNKMKESWRLAQSIFNLVTASLILLSVILSILMPQIMHLIVPGFDQTRTEKAVLISRIMFLQSIIFGWSYVIGGVLNAYKRFTAYSLAPLLYNTAIIIGAFLGPKIGIIGLAWSVVVGAFLHFLIQYLPARSLGFKIGTALDISSQTIRQIFRLMIPRNLSLGAQQLNLIVFTAMASSMAIGSITVFNLTNDFQTTPTVIFANSVAVALFPTLSELANQKNWSEFRRVLTKSLRITIFFLIPSTVLMIILRAQIIRLYVGLGENFNWEVTKMAIWTLAYFSIGIVPSGIAAIFARVFYALKNTKLPMYLGFISIVSGILFALYSRNLGVSGLALAISVSNTVNAALLYLVFKKVYNQPIEENQILKTSFVSAAGSLIMGLVVWLVLHLVDTFYHLEQIPTSTEQVFGLALQALLALTAGILFFWLFAKIFLKEELLVLHRSKQTNGQ